MNPAYSDSGSLFELYLPGTASSALPTNTLLTPFRVHQYLYFLPLNLNYELDLWGKLRNRYRADLLTAEAQEQAYLALLLSLTSDLAATYFQLRAFDAQLETMKKAVAAYENVYNLTHSRFQKGLATQMDINLAKANLADTQSSYENLLQQRKVAENEIAVLMGQSPSEFHLESSPLRTEPPRLPPNIPSTVLMQRPDIGQLERDLATQNALIGAAVAGYFPNINLTGAIGYSSPDLTQFLKWISRYWAMGANAKQVAWDWGKLDADVSANFARFGQASDNYRQQVLTALKEVENALSTLEQVDNQYKHLRLAYEALNSSYLLMNERYQKGLSNVIDATLSEISALQAEVQIENMLGISYVSTVQLIKAFGGRWE